MTAREVSSEERPLAVEEIVERMAWKLCGMENEVWDEAPASYHNRYRREASQMLSSKRIDQSIEGLFLALRSSRKTVDADAPERLWLSAADEEGEHAFWFEPDEGGTPYIRADLATPEVPSEGEAVDPKRWREHIGNIDGLMSTRPSPAASSEVTEEMVQGVNDQAEHVRLGIACRFPDVKEATIELLNRIAALTAALKGYRS